VSFLITIDGPAASGKTTISRELARRLGCPWVSTGAFYRGLAFVALAKKVDLAEETELAALSAAPSWRVELTDQDTLVFFEGRDVTESLKADEMGRAASRVSQFPAVRRNLLAAQRACFRPERGLVAEGRDCGTVVFPSADLKIFLTADSEARAQRRADQAGGSVADIRASQIQRDLQDKSRSSAPMQVPDNAEVIDTSTMTLSAVIAHVERLAKGRLASLLKK
jgi:cytidylate kinase